MVCDADGGQRMKIKKKMKRFLAALLILSISVTCHAEAFAATGTYGVLKERSEKEMEQIRREASPLYNELVKANGTPRDPGENLTDDGDEWVKKLQDKATSEGINFGLDQIKDKAKYQARHLWRGSKDYYANRDLFRGIGDVIDSFGSFMGVTDALTKFPEMLKLQGKTAQDQIMELAVLTAEFGVAAFATIGVSLSFPWGLILGFTLDLLLELIRNGAFELPASWNGGGDFDMGRQRYKLPDGTNVYKPNIYIYSREKREVTVIFDEPELLTKTIPEYTDGWQVTAEGESHLTDPSGRMYDYLFYESITEPSVFETEAGWRIAADRRSGQFEEILSGLGFNEQETADFVEFWTEKLDPGVDYIMYPQGTDLVDLAMPVTISSTPESVERIWFVFVKDDGRDVEEPAGYELSRGGEDCSWYVIEWGGLIL